MPMKYSTTSELQNIVASGECTSNSGKLRVVRMRCGDGTVAWRAASRALANGATRRWRSARARGSLGGPDKIYGHFPFKTILRAQLGFMSRRCCKRLNLFFNFSYNNSHTYYKWWMKRTNFRALIRASRCESPNWLKFIAHLCQA